MHFVLSCTKLTESTPHMYLQTMLVRIVHLRDSGGQGIKIDLLFFRRTAVEGISKDLKLDDGKKWAK